MYSMGLLVLEIIKCRNHSSNFMNNPTDSQDGFLGDSDSHDDDFKDSPYNISSM